MSFRHIALPLTARGIPVVPVQPGEKRCLLPNWPAAATTEPSMIGFWDRQNPNYNVGAVGKLDGFVILDCDVKGLVKQIEAATGHKFSETLVVRSAGRGCLHVYYRHTDRSRALGNRNAKGMFDLQADDKYVVGPGSVLAETGKTYDIVHDYPIIDFPDWLADWVAANSNAPKKFDGELSSVDDDFDIDEMLEHYGITYVQQCNWYNCYVECPVAGYQHEHSKMPGFFFNGDELGFNCWASGCPSKGWNAGKVIKYLNQTHTPYPKLIWPRQELDYAALGIEEDQLPAADAVGSEDEPVFRQPKRVYNITVKAKTANATTPLSEEEIVTLLGAERLQIAETKIVEAAPEPADPVAPVVHDLLMMPEECMYGWLGEKTKELDVPFGYGYPAMLSMAATRILVHPAHVRPTLYVCLIGPVHWGKTQAMERAKSASEWSNPEVIQERMPYSDRGLAKLFKSTAKQAIAGPKAWATAETRLLLCDELRGLMGKINVPNSVLSPVLCSLWNSDKAGGADKKSDDEIFARLNILGGLAAQNPEQFTAQFGQETSAGLYDRFVYGLAPKLKYAVPEIVPEPRCPVPVSVPTYCYELMDAWRDEVEEGRERLGEIALRIAVITSGINHEGTVSPECMRTALNFMEWQEAIRLRFKPSIAEQDKESRCTEAIINAFKNCKDTEGKPVWKHWRVMYKNRNWHGYGAPTVNRIKKALCESGILVEEQERDPDSSDDQPKSRKTGRVCYGG